MTPYLKRMLLLLLAGGPIVAAQTVPEAINYQGKLMDGTNLYSGTVPITFRLYDAPAGGGLPFCEDSNDVTVVDGLYSTRIGDDVIWGSLDNALNQTQVWIEVVIGTNVIAPRERLASVGYARYAARLPANAVDMAMIAPDAVQYWHIADDQVRSNHIQAGSVANAHLADGTISSAKYGFESVDLNALAQDSVYFWHIADDQVRGNHIQAGAVSNAQLAASAVTSNRIDWSTMPSWQAPLNGYAENGSFATAPTAAGVDSIAMGHGGTAEAAYGVVGGGYDNLIENQATNSIIAGGRSNRISTTAYASAIGGGEANVVAAGTDHATIAGGSANQASGNGSVSIGGGYHNLASGTSATIGGGQLNRASGYAATVGGGDGNEASNQYATVGGGLLNVASRECSTVAGGEENIASGGYATVGGGFHNEASGYEAAVGGGNGNTAGGLGSTVAGGGGNRADGPSATVPGGFGNWATGEYSVAAGFRSAADQYGQSAHASGCFVSQGDAQASEYVLRNSISSSGTWEDLYLNGADRHLQIATNQSVVFLAQVVGRSDTGETGAYRIEGLLEGQAGGGVVAGGVTVTDIWEDDAAWDVRVFTGLGATQDVYFQVMGNGETIRWVSTVRTTEVRW